MGIVVGYNFAKQRNGWKPLSKWSS